MATAGLPFANPFMDKMNLGEAPDPYAPFNPTSSIGLGGLAPSAADMAVTGQALVKQTQFTMPEMKQPPSIAYSPASKQLFINGITFAADDATKALQSEQFLKGPGTGLPQGGDWVPLDEQSYGQYLQSIRNPSLSRLASKNFGRGIDSMQALAGRGLQLVGAEETGGRIVAQQEADLAKTAPYERQFTDIESGRGAVEWLVANFAQQGPNLIESILTTGAGFLAGTAAGGPVAGVGGALAGMMGKTAFKEAVIAAATKKAAGTTLSAVENKLLREAAGIAGAVTTSYAQNLATGAADIYGELRDQGAGAGDTGARLKALAGSIPYAALETLPEYLLASRVFGGVGGRAALPGATSTTTKGAAGTTTVTTEPSRLARGAELLRRGAVGGAVGGTLEGTTELGQEGLLLGISGQDLTSPESVNRLINSFAAGFGVGGPIGAAANLRSKQPENLLSPGQKAEPTKGRALMVPQGSAIEPYYTPVNFMGASGGGPIYTQVGAAQKPSFPAVGAPPNQPPLLPAPPPGTAVDPYYTDVTFMGKEGGGPIYPEVGGTSAPPAPPLGGPPAPPAPPTPQLGGPLALGAPPTPPLLGGPTGLGTPQQLGTPPLLGGPTAQTGQNLGAENLGGIFGASNAPPTTDVNPAEQRAFGNALGAVVKPTLLRGASNVPLTRALLAGDAAKVLSALAKSKNKLVSYLAEKASKLTGLKFNSQEGVGEEYQRNGGYDQNLEIAKVNLAGLELMRAAKAVVDAAPGDMLPSLGGYSTTVDTIKQNGEPYKDTLYLANMFAGKDKASFYTALENLEQGVGKQEDLIRSYVRMASTRTAIAAKYDASTNTISASTQEGFNGQPLGTRDTHIAHEIAHALSVEAIKNPSPAQKPIVKKLRTLFDAVKNDPLLANTYGVTAFEEFVAEGSSNPDFQFRLSKIKYENTTAMGKFAEYIAQLLGLKPDNAFTEFLTLFDDLVNAPTTPKASTPKRGGAQGLKRGKTKKVAAPETITFDNGDTYTGQMKDGEPNGQGVYTFADGAVYVGEMKDGTLSGKGVYTFADGTVLEGTFKDSELQEAPKAPATKAASLKKGKKNAVQEPSTTKVSPRKSTGVSKGVGAEVSPKQTTTKKGDALKTKGKGATDSGKDQSTFVETALKRGELAQAGRQWSQYADPKTQPKWKDLSPEQQEKWRQAVADGKPTIAATEEIAPSKKEDTPPKKSVAAAAAPVEVEALTPAEAWEDMKPDGAPVFADLPSPMQDSWTRIVGRNSATIEQANLIAESFTEMSTDTDTAPVDSALTTPAELLVQDIQTANETTDIAAFKNAMQNVMYFANFAGEDTNIKKLVSQAQAFLANTEFSDAQMNAMDEVFLDLIRLQTRLEARYKGGARKGENKPWFGYAVKRNLLPSINVRITNMPEEYKKQTNPVTNKTTEEAPDTSADTMSRTPEALLGELISDLISRIREYSKLTQPVNFYGQSYDNIVALATELYAATNKQGKNYIVRGYKLKDYFKADGSPKMLKSGNRYLFTTTELTPAEQKLLEKEQRDAAKLIAQQQNAEAVAAFEREQMEKNDTRPGYTRNVIDQAADNINEDWDSDRGGFFRADGTPDSKTIAPGRVRLLVNNFLAKLRVKPSVTIYANVADLKKRNPDLYRRAAAARKEGDFDTTNAAGYSFGPNVIIFTDFVRTEQQLKFVLAHETLGHFGFKGVIPKAKLDEVLNKIHDLDPGVQAAVEAMMSTRGMSKLEAIEEYLADNAAELDTSLITRMWNVLKNFLNKLGFEFQDDEARYFVNLARKYVRQGDTGSFVNARSIMGGLESIGQNEADGRYARIFAGDMGSRLFSTGALNRRFGGSGGLMGTVDAFAKGVFGARRDVPGTVSRILEQLQTLDNKARRSYGLNQIYRLLEKQQQYARQLLSKYQRMTSYTHSPDLGFFGKGVSEKEKQTAGELLARAALLRAAQATDKKIKSYDSLVTIDANGNVTVDPTVRREIEKAGFVTADEFRKGFEITYTDGSKAKFQFDVDESSPEWKIYTELRDTVNESAIDLMLANYEAAQAETRRVLNELNDDRSGTNMFSAEDLAAIRRAAEMYQNMRYAGSDVANAGVEIKKQADKTSENFVIAFGRALFDDKVAAIWLKDPSVDQTTDMFKDLSEFQKAEYDDLRAVLPSLRAKFKGDEDTRKQQSFRAQKAIRDMFLFDLQSKNADYYAKRTILGAYVPFTRRGTEQVRLVAVDAKGNTVSLDENIRASLPYFQFKTRDEAMSAAAELEKEFGADNEFILVDDKGAETKLRLKVEVSRTRQSPDLTESVNFNEFVYVLNRLNINLAPAARERIVTTLTSQNSRARRNLQRSGTEGWDKDVVRSVSEHLETTAHVAAKKLHNHRLNDTLLNNDNWLGDDALIRDLKKAVDKAQTDGERARAQRAYDEYAHMYRYMKGSAGDNTVTINGKEVPTLGRGEDYREEAKKVLRWYSETSNISDSTEDMLSGEAGSALKLATVLMQLGGSVATAVINLASLATHSLPYLSYYNPKRGYGGGYGEAKSATALWKAASDIKNFKLGDAAFIEEMMRDASYEKYGLTEDEAQFLFDQTEQGTLQAAQFNALVGTARGKVFNNKAQSAVKAWMSMFSYTEQFNRRATALAAYRLEKDRLQSQGVTDTAQLISGATEAARTAVNTSQGEYAMFNRPEMARGNVLQYIFMYKQFVIVTVQLMKSLPVKGQLLMLGLLLLTSGLKGLPFAEDIFDIVDTIAQKLGLKMGSIEKEIAEWVDSVAPGMTPFVMRGVLDRMTGATMSSRMGMGDLIPLTGAFKAGADPAREISDFAGPVFSGISGLVGMAGSFAKYGAEVIGLRDDVTSISGILRDSPIAAIRALADGYAYMDSGMITNNRGQVVSREAPGHVILARILGFYPAIATEQNDIVRISKDVANYAKAIKADYVSAYVKAKLDKDTDRMQQITADVRQWNEDAKGTGLEISKFASSANRAALEAARPTVARYLKSAPKQMRPETIELLRLNGLEDEVR